MGESLDKLPLGGYQPFCLTPSSACSPTHDQSEWLRAERFQDSGGQLGAGWGGWPTRSFAHRSGLWMENLRTTGLEASG